MVVKTASFGISGIDGYLVEVEASSNRGLPRIYPERRPEGDPPESVRRRRGRNAPVHHPGLRGDGFPPEIP